MTQDHINIGPIRPTTGPLARLGGAATAQPLGGGTMLDQVSGLQQSVRSLQDQLYAVSQFFDQLIQVPMLIASGPNHQPGVVPDPGSTAGTVKVLREDGTFSYPTILRPDTDSTTAIQLQNAAGTAVVNVDTTNGLASVGTTTPYAGANPAKFQVHNGTDQNLLFRPKINLANGVALHSIDDAYGTSKGLELIGSAIFLNSAAPSVALAGVPVYANNAAAVAGGLGQGAWYRTGADPDFICIVH